MDAIRLGSEEHPPVAPDRFASEWGTPDYARRGAPHSELRNHLTPDVKGSVLAVGCVAWLAAAEVS